MMGEATPEGGNPVTERGVFRCLSHKLLDSLSFAVMETVTKTIATPCLGTTPTKKCSNAQILKKDIRDLKKIKKFLKKF